MQYILTYPSSFLPVCFQDISLPTELSFSISHRMISTSAQRPSVAPYLYTAKVAFLRLLATPPRVCYLLSGCHAFALAKSLHQNSSSLLQTRLPCFWASSPSSCPPCPLPLSWCPEAPEVLLWWCFSHVTFTRVLLESCVLTQLWVSRRLRHPILNFVATYLDVLHIVGASNVLFLKTFNLLFL